MYWVSNPGAVPRQNPQCVWAWFSSAHEGTRLLPALTGSAEVGQVEFDEWTRQATESFTIPSQGWHTTELPGCARVRIFVRLYLTRGKLGCRASGGRLLEELCRFAHFRDPKDQERSVGARLSSGVTVVDVDSLFAKPRRNASKLP